MALVQCVVDDEGGLTDTEDCLGLSHGGAFNIQGNEDTVCWACFVSGSKFLRFG